MQKLIISKGTVTFVSHFQCKNIFFPQFLYQKKIPKSGFGRLKPLFSEKNKQKPNYLDKEKQFISDDKNFQ